MSAKLSSKTSDVHTISKNNQEFSIVKVTTQDVDNFKKELDTDDHMITLYQLTARYNTSLSEGLDNEFAKMLLRKNGPNSLIPPKQKSRWLILAGYLFGGFSMLLWFGALFSFVGVTLKYFRAGYLDEEHVYLGGILVAVVLITGFFSFYQESVNMTVMEGFAKMMPKCAFVIREGQQQTIPSEELVVGDLVIVKAGFCIPADIRVIEANVMKVDNSSITGESEPQNRFPVCTDSNPLETANLAFYGTNMIEGSGQGIVIATGKDTLMGHIAGLTTQLEADDTNINKELKRFMRIISIMAIGIGIVCFVLSLVKGYDLFSSFIFFIAIIVANVPAGLLATMTACLTLTAKRMANKNCLVKNLQAIETLGSTNVICSDKTGTLTQNRMTVSHMYYEDEIVDILCDDYTPDMSSNSFKMLCRVGVLCSKADYDQNDMDLPVEKRRIIGDASERAVFQCMEKICKDVLWRRLLNPKVCEIPFNSTNKYQLSIHRRQKGAYVLVMKGAPERIMARCVTIAIGDKDLSIENYKNSIAQAILKMGYMGERVLGFADLELSPQKFPQDYQFNATEINFPIEGLRFVGLMSMIDPPKVGVLEAVSKCKTAGIRVIMLTGDHPITAMAIAKKVGIISSGNLTVYDIAMKQNISVTKVTKEEADMCNAIVLSGSDLRNMTDDEIDNVIVTYAEIVFARTSPQQKLQIVEAFQRKKFIVAVTGDGVNDSPALKKADIGVSMGITGSDVSKEAADMILLDDNFTTIVAGIEEGRLIFDNLKKSIAYLLTSNLPEIIPFLMFVLAATPPPMSIMAIIIIDVGTDLWPAISLAYEKPEADIMMRMPRDPVADRLVNSRLLCFTYLQIGVIQTCAGLLAYFMTMAQYGFFYDRIFGIRKEWSDQYINDLKDSYGYEWSYIERRILERKCYSSFFLAIVITQICDAIICKTRRLSIFQQGMSNWVLNIGCIFEACLAIFVVYCPYVNHALQFEPVPVVCYICALPFGILIIVYDEIRRYLIRKAPGGWFERETFF